jgi:hypothetical protein
MAYDVLKGVNNFEGIKTSSKHYGLGNNYLLEYVIEGNEAMNGFEGNDVKQLVTNFQKIRQECLNFRNVYRLLGK